MHTLGIAANIVMTTTRISDSRTFFSKRIQFEYSDIIIITITIHYFTLQPGSYSLAGTQPQTGINDVGKLALERLALSFWAALIVNDFTICF